MQYCSLTVEPSGGNTWVMGDDGGFHGFLSLQRRGLLALPQHLRDRYHLDEPGAQVEVTERVEDGVIELRPNVAVPAKEAWFWDETWQKGEREVDEHVRAGRITWFDSAADFLDALDALDEEE